MIAPDPRLLNVLRRKIPQAELTVTTLPQCPEYSLWLLSADYPQWALSDEEIVALMENPPYWSFCWASGQALASFFTQHPHCVKDKTVLDFGAGSGIAGIAAKMAGAKHVIACDNDPAAIIACQANARLNHVSLEFCDDLFKAPPADVIVVADVFYDRDNLPLLSYMNKRFREVWVADSRLKGEPLEKLQVIEQVQSFTVPDLNESSEFNRVSLYTSAPNS